MSDVDLLSFRLNARLMAVQQHDLTAPTMDAPVEPPLDSPRAATVWNDSGGVGKTTVTINTADALGRMGYSVLVIDLDPQTGSFTNHVGADAARSQVDVTNQIVNHPDALAELIIDGSQPVLGLKFDLLPSSPSLEDFSKAVSAYDGNRVNLLRSAIKRSKLGNRYDVILIDAPGNRNLLVQNALIASRNVLIPVEATPKGQVSLDGLREYVLGQEEHLRRDGIDIKIGINGIVPSIVEGQLNNTTREALKKYNERRTEEGLPITPFFLWERNILVKAWRENQTLRNYIGDGEKRIRKNERDIPRRFDYIAHLVITGNTNGAEEEFDDWSRL